MSVYKYQFQGGFKPSEVMVDGFVSIGTGGLLNTPGLMSGTSQQTGFFSLALMPGQATAGVPTGWVGGFSGAIGLYGAGVKGIQRVATGQYVISIDDTLEQYTYRLDTFQVTPYAGATGGTGIDYSVIDHTVGVGNTIATGGMTGWLGPGINEKGNIYLQFTSSTSGLPVDLGSGAGYWLFLRLRDKAAGPQ